MTHYSHWHVHPHTHQPEHAHAAPMPEAPGDAIPRCHPPAHPPHHAGEHSHEHGHTHEHGAPYSPGGAPLERGSGAGQILFFDAFAGMAGDMTIAALVDLGVPRRVVENAVAMLPVEGVELSFWPVRTGSIGALRFDVKATAGQPRRTHRTIDQMLEESALDSDTKSMARRVFEHLAQAEAEVHRMPADQVHFHEVGAVDAIVDIVGAAACLTYLGAEVVVSPLPMGRGTVVCQHGTLPLPAPATVNCLRGLPTFDAGIDAELVTPTGAAIAATVATRYERWPRFAPQRVGWGAGSRALPDRPNALRVVLGTRTEPALGHLAGAASGSKVLIEANVDDMSGELAAHAVETLISAGALDAWVVPIIMKKGRPAMTFCVLSDPASADRLTDLVLSETTTIGVRRVSMDRVERSRRIIEVSTPFGVVRVKVSEGPQGAAQLKPEFDDCARIARERGCPVRQVIAQAMAAALAATDSSSL